MSDDRMQTQCFSIPPSMIRAVRDRASAESMSMSYVVRLALRAYLAKQSHPSTMQRDAADRADDASW